MATSVFILDSLWLLGIKFMVEIRKSYIDELKLFSTLDKQQDVKKYVTQKSPDEYIDEFYNPDMLYLTIINKDKKIAGYFIIVREDKIKGVEIRRIIIDENERGIGQQAIQEMEKFCKMTLKVQRIWLDVFEHNHRGRHVYRKLGYTKFKEGICEGKKLYFLEKQL